MATTEIRRIRTTVLLALASLLLAEACFLGLPDLFEPWSAKAVDQLFRARSASERLQLPYDSTVVHVDLNDASIQQLADFYPNRRHHAQVIRNLAAMGVVSQLRDFVFAARTQKDEDQALVAAASQTRVYFGLAFELSDGTGTGPSGGSAGDGSGYLEQTKWQPAVIEEITGLLSAGRSLVTFEALASASAGLGYLNVEPDRDGVYRRIPLLVRYGDAYYPSLVLKVACDLLGVPPASVAIGPGNRVTLRNAHRPGRAVEDVVIPVDAHGCMTINYIGTWERMTHYGFADVYRASDDPDDLEVWQDELRGKVAIVAEVATGSSDVGPVPTDTHFPLSGLHAHAIHTILTGSFVRALSPGSMLLVEVLLLCAIAALCLRTTALVFSTASLGVCCAYVALSVLCFFHANLIVDIVRPLLMLVFAVTSTATYRYFDEEKEKRVLRRSFEAYFPPRVVRKIMQNPEVITEGGEKKELTILFSDIKSFSTHSADMAPEDIQRLLNEYFGAMTDIVFSFGGTVDKFIGDGLMVFFGDPEPQPDHAHRAVLAAIEMQRKTRELRAAWEARGDFPIEIRIGINTGDVSVGNMGSCRRLSYTVVGADVNLAQRLETNAPVGGIMISQRTHDLVKGRVATHSLGTTRAKGFAEPVAVYGVPVEA